MTRRVTARSSRCGYTRATTRPRRHCRCCKSIASAASGRSTPPPTSRTARTRPRPNRRTAAATSAAAARTRSPSTPSRRSRPSPFRRQERPSRRAAHVLGHGRDGRGRRRDGCGRCLRRVQHLGRRRPADRRHSFRDDVGRRQPVRARQRDLYSAGHAGRLGRQSGQQRCDDIRGRCPSRSRWLQR